VQVGRGVVGALGQEQDHPGAAVAAVLALALLLELSLECLAVLAL
jgi:hypothetical protein